MGKEASKKAKAPSLAKSDVKTGDIASFFGGKTLAKPAKPKGDGNIQSFFGKKGGKLAKKPTGDEPSVAADEDADVLPDAECDAADDAPMRSSGVKRQTGENGKAADGDEPVDADEAADLVEVLDEVEGAGVECAEEDGDAHPPKRPRKRRKIVDDDDDGESDDSAANVDGAAPMDESSNASLPTAAESPAHVKNDGGSNASDEAVEVVALETPAPKRGVSSVIKVVSEDTEAKCNVEDALNGENPDGGDGGDGLTEVPETPRLSFAAKVDAGSSTVKSKDSKGSAGIRGFGRGVDGKEVEAEAEADAEAEGDAETKANAKAKANVNANANANAKAKAKAEAKAEATAEADAEEEADADAEAFVKQCAANGSDALGGDDEGSVGSNSSSDRGSDAEDDENAEEDSDEDRPVAAKENVDTKSEAKATKAKPKQKTKPKGAAVPSVSLAFDEKATWDKGKPVPYRFLADAFAKVEAIHGRLEIQAILTDVFRKVIDTTPADLVPVIYLCVNKLAPAHEGIEIGVGEMILMKALSQTSGCSLSVLRSMYKKVGDLGDVAAGARSKQTTMFPPPPLKVRGVYADFRKIAESSGKAAVEGKKKIILKLLVASQTKNEARYLARALQGKLRIHLADKTVVSSLANAITLSKLKQGTGVLLSVDGKRKAKMTEKEEKIGEQLKDAANRLSAIYNQLPVWEKIIPVLLEERDVNNSVAKKVKFTPGVPISPMLAKPTKAIAEVLSRFAESKFTCEFKYDGERAQVHRLADGSVKIYSRNAEDLTPKYPDLCTALPLALKDVHKGASFVLDGESVAYDLEKKKILPFQELQSRKRKEVAEADVKIKVCVFAFDLLYFNGKSLLLESLSARREIMTSSFDEVEGVFMFAKGHDSRDPDEILELLNESIKSGCEGLMVKALDGPNGTYEPANRSQNWLKVKKDYLDGMGDTLDLVPIGGYTGKGKRVGTYGGFLLACYDPENEEYQSICKIGTGFSDKDLESLSAFYNDEDENRLLDAPKSYYRVSDSKGLAPDVWFDACQVWEVKCADLSISPQHKAGIGLVDADKGIALRFPRFLRLRDDKGPEEATSSEQVSELYTDQAAVANKRK